MKKILINNITGANVDDFLRQERNRGVKSIKWTKDTWQIFSYFYEAVMSCGIGIFSEIDIKVMSDCAKNHSHKPPIGKKFRFMGIDHLYKKQ